MFLLLGCVGLLVGSRHLPTPRRLLKAVVRRAFGMVRPNFLLRPWIRSPQSQVLKGKSRGVVFCACRPPSIEIVWIRATRSLFFLVGMFSCVTLCFRSRRLGLVARLCHPYRTALFSVERISVHSPMRASISRFFYILFCKLVKYSSEVLNVVDFHS